MIRALEEHLAAWMKAELTRLAGESALFGPIGTVTGDLTLPAPLPEGEIGLLVRADSLVPVPESRDLGAAPVTQWAALHLQARVSLRVAGAATPLADAPGRDVAPPGAHVHRVDLAALTVLALLKERPAPAPDWAEPPAFADTLGKQPAGAVTAAQGLRQAQLYWTAIEAGEATIGAAEEGGWRLWDIPLTALCTFRLSPAALSGGSILQIGQTLDVQDGAGSRRIGSALYAAAEAIPLSFFAGLGDPALVELAQRGIGTLGALVSLDAAALAELTAALKSAMPEERSLLGQLADMARLRRTAAASLGSFALEPDVMALPARALLDPTPEEKELLVREVDTAGLYDHLAVLAVPVASLLAADKRERVSVGVIMGTRG